MKKLVRFLLPVVNLVLLPFFVRGQSVTIYLCNDCTYRSSRDNETITFMTSGKVKINGRPAPLFRCRNNDGTVELRYKGKLVNNLNWNEGQKKGYYLLDDRGIGYTLVKCTGNMPSMEELMHPELYPRKHKK
jgi:hypothetical protein